MRINPLSAGTNYTATGVAPARQQTATDREREARVAELRDRYVAGTYHVDARAVAAAIVDEHLAASSELQSPSTSGI